jgi:hypothetical protein
MIELFVKSNILRFVSCVIFSSKDVILLFDKSKIYSLFNE